MSRGDWRGVTATELSCHHVVGFTLPPKPGEVVYCRHCADYRNVVSEPSKNRIRCDTCTVAKLFGTDTLAARDTATGHVTRYPSHVVTVTTPGGEETVRNNREGDTVTITRTELRARVQRRTLLPVVTTPHKRKRG